MFPDLQPLGSATLPSLKRAPLPHSPDIVSKRTRLAKERPTKPSKFSVPQFNSDVASSSGSRQAFIPPIPIVLLAREPEPSPQQHSIANLEFAGLGIPDFPLHPPSKPLPSFIHDFTKRPERRPPLTKDDLDPDTLSGLSSLDIGSAGMLHLRSSSIRSYLQDP